jgi:hypothetical protein
VQKLSKIDVVVDGRAGDEEFCALLVDEFEIGEELFPVSTRCMLLFDRFKPFEQAGELNVAPDLEDDRSNLEENERQSEERKHDEAEVVEPPGDLVREEPGESFFTLTEIALGAAMKR